MSLFSWPRVIGHLSNRLQVQGSVPYHDSQRSVLPRWGTGQEHPTITHTKGIYMISLHFCGLHVQQFCVSEYLKANVWLHGGWPGPRFSAQNFRKQCVWLSRCAPEFPIHNQTSMVYSSHLKLSRDEDSCGVIVGVAAILAPAKCF